MVALGGCGVLDSFTGPSDSTPASAAQGAEAQARAGDKATAPVSGAPASLAAANAVPAAAAPAGAQPASPPPGTAQFNAANTAAMNATATKPYPKLSSVPPPPSTGPTAAQRAAMANSLIEDRSHAIYADNQVRDNNANIASLVAQSQIPQNIPMQQLGRPGSQVRRTASAALPAGGGDVPRRAPVAQVRRQPLLGPSVASQAPAPQPAPAAPVPNDSGLSAGGALGVAAAAPSSAPVNDSGLSAGGALGGDNAAPRATPQPEATQPPPPPPKLAPSPAISKSAPKAPEVTGKAAANNAPAAVPEQVGALPSAPALSAAPAAMPSSAPAAAAGVSHLGTVKFAAGSSTVASGDPAIASAASAYKAKGGKIRVVGYAPQAAAESTGGVLSGYQAALANATAVKKALVAAGVPAADIVAEAGPKAESAHADILLAH
ncbi:MAG TPA: hypothetical protein VL574_13830 [Stellaceae bacterium]|nr:hypothetical protein [Stellaceae bacterium]